MSHDFVSIDLLLVTPELEPIWQTRQILELQSCEICVMSKEGLIALKKLRNSAQDRADIEVLKHAK